MFSTSDPRGYAVSLDKERYERHIIGESGHTEVPAKDIQKAVEKPCVIYGSGYKPTCDVYFAKSSSVYPALYVRVIVEMDEEQKKGDVVTSYISKKIDGQIDLKGGPKYLDINNKL